MVEFAGAYGVAATLREHRKKFQLTESTFRGFKKKLGILKSKAKSMSSFKRLVNRKLGRFLIWGELDELVQKFLKATDEGWYC